MPARIVGRCQPPGEASHARVLARCRRSSPFTCHVAGLSRRPSATEQGDALSRGPSDRGGDRRRAARRRRHRLRAAVARVDCGSVARRAADQRGARPRRGRSRPAPGRRAGAARQGWPPRRSRTVAGANRAKCKPRPCTQRCARPVVPRRRGPRGRSVRARFRATRRRAGTAFGTSAASWDAPARERCAGARCRRGAAGGCLPRVWRRGGPRSVSSRRRRAAPRTRRGRRSS